MSAVNAHRTAYHQARLKELEERSFEVEKNPGDFCTCDHKLRGKYSSPHWSKHVPLCAFRILTLHYAALYVARAGLAVDRVAEEQP